jgi:hypothetical protein
MKNVINYQNSFINYNDADYINADVQLSTIIWSRFTSKLA